MSGLSLTKHPKRATDRRLCVKLPPNPRSFGKRVGAPLAACGNLARVGKDNGNVKYKRSEKRPQSWWVRCSGPRRTLTNEVTDDDDDDDDDITLEANKSGASCAFLTNERPSPLYSWFSRCAEGPKGQLSVAAPLRASGQGGYRSAEKPREKRAPIALCLVTLLLPSVRRLIFIVCSGRWAANRVTRYRWTRQRAPVPLPLSVINAVVIWLFLRFGSYWVMDEDCQMKLKLPRMQRSRWLCFIARRYLYEAPFFPFFFLMFRHAADRKANFCCRKL